MSQFVRRMHHTDAVQTGHEEIGKDHIWVDCFDFLQQFYAIFLRINQFHPGILQNLAAFLLKFYTVI